MSYIVEYATGSCDGYYDDLMMKLLMNVNVFCDDLILGYARICVL